MSATEAVSLPETIEDRKVIFKARGLVQVFGRVVALDACDLDLYQGEVLAVILLTWLLGMAFGLAVELDARQCAEFERATGTRDAEVAR